MGLICGLLFSLFLLAIGVFLCCCRAHPPSPSSFLSLPGQPPPRVVRIRAASARNHAAAGLDLPLPAGLDLPLPARNLEATPTAWPSAQPSPPSAVTSAVPELGLRRGLRLCRGSPSAHLAPLRRRPDYTEGYPRHMPLRRRPSYAEGQSGLAGRLMALRRRPRHLAVGVAGRPSAPSAFPVVS